jgi:hypothetical protein
VEFTVSIQEFCHEREIGSKTFGTDVIERLSDDTQGTLHLRSVGGPSLLATRFTLDRALQQTDEALAVQASDSLHLIEKPASLTTTG